MTKRNQNIAMIAGDSYDIEITVTGTIEAGSTVEFVVNRNGKDEIKKTTAGGITLVGQKITIPLSTAGTKNLRGTYTHVTRLKNGEKIHTVTIGSLTAESAT